MALSDVRKALVAAYVAMGLDLPTQWENKYFDPPAGANWARFNWTPGQPEVSTLGEAGVDFCRGFVQISLVFPEDSGEEEAMTLADQFRPVFWAGRSFTYDGQAVTIQSTGRSSGQYVENSYRVYVTINWSAFIKRKE